MEVKKMIQVLQHYRHNFMNDLQVIHGYLSMDNKEKVKDIITNVVASFHEERKLMNLNAPNFIWWVIQANIIYTNIRLNYTISVEQKDLSSFDDQLLELCEHIVQTIKKYGSQDELYDLQLNLNHVDDEIIQFTYSINGSIPNREKFEQYLIHEAPIHTKKAANEFISMFHQE